MVLVAASCGQMCFAVSDGPCGKCARARLCSCRGLVVEYKLWPIAIGGEMAPSRVAAATFFICMPAPDTPLRACDRCGTGCELEEVLRTRPWWRQNILILRQGVPVDVLSVDLERPCRCHTHSGAGQDWRSLAVVWSLCMHAHVFNMWTHYWRGHAAPHAWGQISALQFLYCHIGLFLICWE